jgi:hypothetical protein
MLTTKPTLSLSLKIKKENNVEPEPAQTTETVVDNNVSEETLPTIDNANQIMSIIPKIVLSYGEIENWETASTP